MADTVGLSSVLLSLPSNHTRINAGTKSTVGIEPASCVTNTTLKHVSMSRRCLSLVCPKQAFRRLLSTQQSLKRSCPCSCHFQNSLMLHYPELMLRGSVDAKSSLKVSFGAFLCPPKQRWQPGSCRHDDALQSNRLSDFRSDNKQLETHILVNRRSFSSHIDVNMRVEGQVLIPSLSLTDFLGLKELT